MDGMEKSNDVKTEALNQQLHILDGVHCEVDITIEVLKGEWNKIFGGKSPEYCKYVADGMEIVKAMWEECISELYTEEAWIRLPPLKISRREELNLWMEALKTGSKKNRLQYMENSRDTWDLKYASDWMVSNITAKFLDTPYAEMQKRMEDPEEADKIGKGAAELRKRLEVFETMASPVLDLVDTDMEEEE